MDARCEGIEGIECRLGYLIEEFVVGDRDARFI